MYPRKPWSGGSAECARSDAVSITANLFEVNNGHGNFNFFNGVLVSSGDNLAIDRNAATSVEVGSLAIASSQVAEHVAPSRLERSRPDQLHCYVSFPQLHVASTAVDNDLDSIKSKVNVGCRRVPQFLTDLVAKNRVLQGEHTVSNRDT